MSDTNELAVLANSLPANLRQRAADTIASDIARVGATGGKDTVRVTQDKKFELPDGTKVSELEAHIVDFVYSNTYYSKPFNRNQIVPPDCAAVSPSETTLEPFDAAPSVQAKSCAVCQQNQFGSALQGQGKACKNKVVLALLPTDPESMGDHDIWVVSLSATAIRPFNKYVKLLASQGIPVPWAKTRLSFDPEQTWATVRCDPVGAVDEGGVDILDQRKSEANERLMQAPDFTPRENNGG